MENLQPETLVLQRNETLFPAQVYRYLESQQRDIVRQVMVIAESVARTNQRLQTLPKDGIEAIKRWFHAPQNAQRMLTQIRGEAVHDSQENLEEKPEAVSSPIDITFETYKMIAKNIQYGLLKFAIDRADELGRAASSDPDTYTVLEEHANAALIEILSDTEKNLQRLGLVEEK